MATCLDLNFFCLHSRLLKTWQQTSRTNLSRKFDNLTRIKPDSASLLGRTSTTKQTPHAAAAAATASGLHSTILVFVSACSFYPPYLSRIFKHRNNPKKERKKEKKKGVNPCWNWMDFYKPLFLRRNSIPRGEIRSCGKNKSKASSSPLHRQTL